MLAIVADYSHAPWSVVVIAIVAVAWLILKLTLSLKGRELRDYARAKTKRECRTCAHFSVEAGQAVLDRYPAFREASKHIPPWKMSATTPANRDQNFTDEEINALADPGYLPDADDTDDLVESLTMKWEEAGLCAKERCIVFPNGGCDLHKTRAPHPKALPVVR